MSVATILIALIVVAVILLGIIITVIVKSRKVKPEEGYDEESDEDDYDGDDYDDEEEEEVRPRRRRPVRQNDETAPIQVQKPKKTKRQWKIIMENLDSWEKYTFIFYDNIGIGRGKRTPEFEKYITINDDPRISKLHCAIIHEGDKLYLKDMESRNGTYLNGQLLEEPVAIQKEDVIGLGQTKIEVKKILRERD